jgi:hydrogenase maturation protease
LGSHEGTAELTEPPAATLVLGLGNTLRGDDGVGVRVVEALATRSLPPGVEVVDGGTQGLALVNLMEGRKRVVFVDAADVGRSPGEFIRFSRDEAVFLGNDQHLSAHASGLRDALLLAEALKVMPDEVVIYGVQPANLEWDDALSPELQASLPDLIAAVWEELTNCSQ